MDEETLERGTIIKFIRDGRRFLVAQTGNGAFCLIGMKDGNRWSEPIEDRTLSALTNGKSEDFEVVKHGRAR